MTYKEIDKIYTMGCPRFYVWSEYGHFMEVGGSDITNFERKYEALKYLFRKGYVVSGGEVVLSWRMTDKEIENIVFR